MRHKNRKSLLYENRIDSVYFRELIGFNGLFDCWFWLLCNSVIQSDFVYTSFFKWLLHHLLLPIPENGRRAYVLLFPVAERVCSIGICLPRTSMSLEISRVSLNPTQNFQRIGVYIALLLSWKLCEHGRTETSLPRCHSFLAAWVEFFCYWSPQSSTMARLALGRFSFVVNQSDGISQSLIIGRWGYMGIATV